jgi:hypothetical protein
LILTFLYIIQLIVIAVLFFLTAIFVVRAIVKRENQKQVKVYVSLSVVCIIITLYIWNIDLFSAETENREKARTAFENNFGFAAPDVIREIKLKNFGMYDSNVHWMAFTYDSIVFNKILVHDQPLDTAYSNTPKYIEIVSELKSNCANCPDWLELPNTNAAAIYFKKDLMKHSSSDYYLWVDAARRMTYLRISYFD